MKTASRLLALSVLATGAFFSTSTFACSTAAWGAVDAAAIAGDPSVNIARVAGKCGLEVSGSGFVNDNTPDGETTFIARFYFFGKNLPAGTHAIFSATSEDNNTGDSHFTVTYDGTDIKVESGAASGNVASATADPNKWNLVEVEWVSGATGSIWVNADATTDAPSGTFNSGTGAIGSARLGAVSALASGSAFFDDYVSHRSLPVGPILAGDGNSDGNVNSGDVNVVVNEFLFNNLGDGSPDCNLDGAVNSGDINCIVAIFLNL